MAFVDRVEKDGGRLDYLVVNAAVALATFSKTQNGWETELQVNHISNTLIAFHLLPQLAKIAEKFGGHARLVIVASDVHALTNFDAARFPSGQVLATLNDEAWTNENKAMELIPRHEVDEHPFSHEHSPPISPLHLPSSTEPSAPVSPRASSLTPTRSRCQSVRTSHTCCSHD